MRNISHSSCLITNLKFMRLTKKDFENAAAHLGVEVAVVKAVQEVETEGRGGFLAPGKPTILFEGHIFWKELKKKGMEPEKYVPGNENILYPKWVRTHYEGGIKEYERLEKAKLIHEEAALASASWGMFRIMGFNYAVCKESCVKNFVNAMCESEYRQLMLFVAFVEKNGWVKYLKNKDWRGFASRYNGPGYEQNGYDQKLEMAYNKYKN